MSEYRYKELLRESLKGDNIDNDSGKRKKRKIGGQYNPNHSNNTSIENQDVITILDSDQESDDSINSSDFEDVSIEDVNLENEEEESYGLSLLPNNLKDSNEKPESLSIAINPVQEEVKKKRKFNSISKTERELRKSIHQMYVGLMLSHGVIRNRWCNDYSLLMELRKSVSPQILELLHQKDSDDVLPLVKSRRFLDGLKKLMMIYSSNYRVTSQGLIRKNWNELSIKQSKTDANVTFSKFFSLVTKFRGSRDIAAQGFVSLLRSVDLNARLIFSLQPPDYTSISELPKIDSTNHARTSNEEVRSSPLLQKFSSGNNKRNLLTSIRKKSTTVTDEIKFANYFEDSPYPIFWAEVWDKYVKKWVSIDPITLQTIEIPPMRRKCKFEPPSTDMRNQLTYVIAYDRLGGVKDVTRRYSLYYNAKTVKKKIHFRSEEDESWYTRILKASCSQLRKNKVNKIDILESKEFHTRDLAEGVPNNIADFKNHPVYALESQLKQNEIIYPKDDSSTCGFFRNKLSKKSQQRDQTVIPIFKRSHVYGLRSAKAWYLRGRVLKVGVQPLKIKKKQTSLKQPTSDDDDDEGMTRLYAEFQTKLYIPPPIVNGMVPKNAYGNIDIYTSSMLPDNGYLVDTSLQYSMKIAERAAKIIDIDYAKAIVAFDFGKPNKKKSQNRNPTAREGGILIDIKYKEAIYLVMNTLLEEEESLRRKVVELNSLNNWRYFLMKLRISERLNKMHGKLNSEDEESNFTDELDNHDFSVHSDNSGSGNEHGGGGFFISDNSVLGTNTDNFATEEYAPTSREFENSYLTNMKENMGDNDENFSNQSEDLIEEQGGGGFFIEDPKPEAIELDPKIDDQLNDTKLGDIPEAINLDPKIGDQLSGKELEDIPDCYFKHDENGELVYDPSSDGDQLAREQSRDDGSNNFKGDSDFLIKDSSEANLHKEASQQDHKVETTSSRVISPEDINDIQEQGENIIDREYMSVLGSQKSLSEIESSQGSLDKDIAEEEQAFGFEYSDTD